MISTRSSKELRKAGFMATPKKCHLGRNVTHCTSSANLALRPTLTTHCYCWRSEDCMLCTSSPNSHFYTLLTEWYTISLFTFLFSSCCPCICLLAYPIATPYNVLTLTCDYLWCRFLFFNNLTQKFLVCFCISIILIFSPLILWNLQFLWFNSYCMFHFCLFYAFQFFWRMR